VTANEHPDERLQISSPARLEEGVVQVAPAPAPQKERAWIVAGVVLVVCVVAGWLICRRSVHKPTPKSCTVIGAVRNVRIYSTPSSALCVGCGLVRSEPASWRRHRHRARARHQRSTPKLFRVESGCRRARLGCAGQLPVKLTSLWEKMNRTVKGNNEETSLHQQQVLAMSKQVQFGHSYKKIKR
jgi:hypothetical protein